jgi:hypothetical protein
MVTYKPFIIHEVRKALSVKAVGIQKRHFVKGKMLRVGMQQEKRLWKYRGLRSGQEATW